MAKKDNSTDANKPENKAKGAGKVKIQLDEFGRVNLSQSTEDINQFLTDNVPDKKFEK